MSYNFEYPIDDDTLFILLALRYDGELEIAGLDSVYDGLVNYDCTLLKQDSKKGNTLDFAGKAIAWVRDEFEVSIEETDDILYLREPNAQKLKNFLDEYFTEFRIYKNYYHTLDEHKDVFVKVIEDNFQDIVEWRKKFTFDITTNMQYKMIQYIGYLMHNKILATPDCEQHIFCFNNGMSGYKKVVGMKFCEGYDIEKFKRERKVRDIFYIFTDEDKDIYNISDNQPICIRHGLKAILYKCIDEDLKYITRKTYWELQDAGAVKNAKGHLSEKRVKDYIESLNMDLRARFGRNFFVNEQRNGKWVLKF